MKKIEIPIADKIPHLENVHGVARTDHYQWMKNKDDQKVLDYLNAENDYTNAVTGKNKVLEKQLFTEMLARIKEDDLSVPAKEDEYFYYSRTEKGKSYPIHFRKYLTLDAKEEILLDENLLAEGHEYFALGDFEVSDDHSLLAYSIDNNGGEQYDIFVKEISSGKIIDSSVKVTSGNLFWANDNTTLFYTELDSVMRPYKLVRHTIKTPVNQDVTVFVEEDPSFFLFADKTKSKAFFIIHLANQITSEAWYLSTNDIEGEFKLFEKRQKNIEYSIEHQGNYFYIVTNENAENFKLMHTLVDKPEKKYWQETFTYKKEIKLDDIETFERHIVIYGRKNGLKCITILDTLYNKKHDLQFPEETYVFWDTSNPEYKSNKLRLVYSSLVTPRTVLEYDMSKMILKTLKEYKVLGNYDKSQFTTKRIFVLAEDGSKIPMSIVHKKDLKLDGTNPCCLYAYGSYGECLDPYFSSNRLSLLERGFVFVIAHVRGGGEMGRHWYENGKFLKKKNTFNDFITCAEFLIAKKYTNSAKLVANGGSAGGLLMGVVSNWRSDLFKLIIAEVPFVDVINTMMDDTLPLTVIEYDEWGNPNDKAYFDYMLTYSPYDNVEKKEYTNILVTAGLNDPRVPYWEPAKWVAKLREVKTDDNLLLLKTNMDTGHGGKTGRYGLIEDTAFEYAVIFDVLDIK